jgi:hypothetical protein
MGDCITIPALGQSARAARHVVPGPGEPGIGYRTQTGRSYHRFARFGRFSPLFSPREQPLFLRRHRPPSGLRTRESVCTGAGDNLTTVDPRAEQTWPAFVKTPLGRLPRLPTLSKGVRGEWHKVKPQGDGFVSLRLPLTRVETIRASGQNGGVTTSPQPEATDGPQYHCRRHANQV